MKIDTDKKIFIAIWLLIAAIVISIILAIFGKPTVEVNNKDINSYLSSMRDRGYKVISVSQNSDGIYTITYAKLYTWSGNEFLVENKSFNNP